AVVPHLKDAVVIQFDEVIDEMATGGAAAGGLDRQVLLSPVSGPVRVEWHRTNISVKPKEGWKRRVYRLEILPGFFDLRRNRLDSAKTVLFTTGPEIGHARLGGIALRWIEQTTLPRALIEAVPLPDSVGYRTLADSGGQFNIENLQPGQYIVYALADENGDRKRGLREAYDSMQVRVDSSSNVALYAFPHDTIPPRPRVATYVDSITIRVEFSQALDPSASFDTAHVHVLQLPDSTPLAIAAVFTQRQYDSVSNAARQKADSAAAAARDSAGRRDSVPPPRIHPTVPPSPVPATPPRRGAAAQTPKAPPVDTALVRQLLARRPIPSDKIVVRLARAMKAETRYVVRIQGATNLMATKGDGDVSFTVPKPNAPADSTQRAPRTTPP
ncbi:MAG: carboxypeptidase-like regulatory domain-containing protein, partial [Gemmatimonadales bacterium]